MGEEPQSTTKEMSPRMFRFLVLNILVGAVIFSVLFLLFSPLEPWLSYCLIGVVWAGDALVIAILHRQYQKNAKPAAGLKWSGFGEQRVDIGTVKRRD